MKRRTLPINPPRLSDQPTSSKDRRGRWLCTAEGDVGDQLYWKDPYTVLEEVRWLFGRLEEFGPEAIPLDELVAGLPVFAGLSGNPPLGRESDFDDIVGMRADERLGWRENRWVGFSSAAVRIFIWSKSRKEILSQARALRARLEAQFAACEEKVIQVKSKRSRQAVKSPTK